MTMTQKNIAFKVDFSRILELLADQIYQSPLALLRENTQNSFDALLMRKQLAHEFEPQICVSIDDEWLQFSDNGIGMTAEEIEKNYWHAGSSGKNTDVARAAGVVGTFGIGAVANFGVADELRVESESAITGDRTASSVLRSELSTESKGISVRSIDATGEPGTIVRAHLAPGSNLPVDDAKRYLREFVEFVDIPVVFNEETVSGATHRTALPTENHAWYEQRHSVTLAEIIDGDLEVFGMATGELRVVLENVKASTGLGRKGAIVLVQGQNVIRTMRSGFGLAAVAIQSPYRWGGVIDLPFLKPTAGREALDDSSNRWLQAIISSLDDNISLLAADNIESFNSNGFLQWIVNKRRYDLCGNLEIVLHPGNTAETLAAVTERGANKYYSGRDQRVIQTYASEDHPLIVLTRRSPRRDCELGYLKSAGASEIDTKPRVEKEIPTDHQSFPQSALAIRLTRVLEEDYFLKVDVRFGSITGTLPLLMTESSDPVTIYLDPDSTSVAPLLALYNDDYNSFTPFVKDFARTTVYPRISHLVPSSTRYGADALLKHLRSNREWFEYEAEDRLDLEEIFKELGFGNPTAVQAVRQLTATRRAIFEVSGSGTEPLSSALSDIDDPTNDDAEESLDARPAIDRRGEATSARILTSEKSVNGYRCFLAISPGVQRENGEFFLHPHSTEIVWGGRKVIFIFHHVSKRFALYYDVLCPGLVGNTSGGGPQISSTILTDNNTFIPVPNEIASGFVPAVDEKIRLAVRGDILPFEEK